MSYILHGKINFLSWRRAQTRVKCPGPLLHVPVLIHSLLTLNTLWLGNWSYLGSLSLIECWSWDHTCPWPQDPTVRPVMIPSQLSSNAMIALSL